MFTKLNMAAAATLKKLNVIIYIFDNIILNAITLLRSEFWRLLNIHRHESLYIQYLSSRINTIQIVREN